MNRIQKKLRSEKGASITFGLLLFLVCAVLSGVIIVASTAAAGRVSNLAESDQKYYAVTSAAELLKDSLSDQTVTIVEVREKSQTSTYDEEGDETKNPPETAASYVYLLPGTINEIDVSSLELEAPIYTSETGEWSPPKSASPNSKNAILYFAYKYAQMEASTSDAPESIDMKLTATPASLNVDIFAEMDADGNLTLQISNARKADENKYKPQILTESFETDKKVSHDNRVIGELEPGTNREDDKIVNDMVDLKLTTISWKVTNIETVK